MFYVQVVVPPPAPVLEEVVPVKAAPVAVEAAPVVVEPVIAAPVQEPAPVVPKEQPKPEKKKIVSVLHCVMLKNVLFDPQ